MPAQSQQQQKLFGLALAFKRGEVPASEVSDEIKDIADRMSEKEIEDFAATKHKGLPKMKEQLRKIVREIMRERAIAEIELSKADMEKLHSDGEVEVDGEKVSFEEAGLPNAMIPSNIKAKLNMAIDKIKGTDLTYNQKLKVVGKIIDSLGIDKKELVKMSTRLRGALESVNEGKKRYYQQDRVGSAKYTISYHDGKKKHKDGSDFFDIQTFRNKKDLAKFVNALHKSGYVYGFNESVINEGYSTEEKRIVMMAVRKIAKYMNVDIKTAMGYVLGAGQELERDIKRGKITK